MEFELQSSRPIWQQLAEQLSRRIVTGVYAPGSRFPTVRELAAEAGVNPNTMQRALGQLESAGLVSTNRTAVSSVLDAIRAKLAKELINRYFSEMEALGFPRARAAEMAAAEKERKV